MSPSTATPCSPPSPMQSARVEPVSSSMTHHRASNDMDILGTLKIGLTVVSQWMSRAWGTQTRDQSTVERDIANAREKKSLAFEGSPQRARRRTNPRCSPRC